MKKFILLLLSILTFCINAQAAVGDFFNDGKLSYTILSEEDHTVSVYRGMPEDVISGDIIIPSTITYNETVYTVVTISNCAFYGCHNITSVTIPDTVIEIGNYAFVLCGGLINVIIPDSVTKIGESAFDRCFNLASITIPNTITKISDCLFDSCSKLTSIKIPESVTEIGNSAFSSCSSLTSITIPESVTKIGKYAFYHCESLTSITIPESVTEIENQVFQRCSGLISVTIPNSITHIGNEAFSLCQNLTSIKIPESVSTIGSYAFAYCTKLTSVEIPESVSSIGDYSFSNCLNLELVKIHSSEVNNSSEVNIGDNPFALCRSLEKILVDSDNSVFESIDGVLYQKVIDYEYIDNVLEQTTTHQLVSFPCGKKFTDFVIPNSVSMIKNYAFYYCTVLNSITIPDSVKEIESGAFRNCTGLNSVTIPNGITDIKNNTFSDCSNLNSVVIPASVITIGDEAFSGCSSLKTIYTYSRIPPTAYVNVFNEVPIDAVVYVPKGRLIAYMASDYWAYFTDFREMGMVQISFNITELSIEKGEYETIMANVNKGDDVTIESETWCSSNPMVATVEDGVVTAVAEGEATITYSVTDNYGQIHSESCLVSVSDTTGIDVVDTDNIDSRAEYFDLNGVRVNSNKLRSGIYIKRQGNKTKKIVVR